MHKSRGHWNPHQVFEHLSVVHTEKYHMEIGGWGWGGEKFFKVFRNEGICKYRISWNSYINPPTRRTNELRVQSMSRNILEELTLDPGRIVLFNTLSCKVCKDCANFVHPYMSSGKRGRSNTTTRIRIKLQGDGALAVSIIFSGKAARDISGIMCWIMRCPWLKVNPNAKVSNALLNAVRKNCLTLEEKLKMI